MELWDGHIISFTNKWTKCKKNNYITNLMNNKWNESIPF